MTTSRSQTAPNSSRWGGSGCLLAWGQPLRKNMTKETTSCRKCGTSFPYRSNKHFCSPRCRKSHSQQARRQKTPANATNDKGVRREQHETFELADRLAHNLYRLPPSERLGYVNGLVEAARSGKHPKLRKILTNPQFIRPDPRDKKLFYKRSSAYCHIAQAADLYCRHSPWRASVDAVVTGKVPEPPTGEVVACAAVAA